MKVILLLLLASALAISAATAAVVMNEVMPKAPEWIEIYNPGQETLNLSNWQIRDNSGDYPDSITCWNISNCSLVTSSEYFLILGRNAAISSITNQTASYYYVDDQAIGNGLGDSGDNISFFSSNYSASIIYGGSQANKSVSRNPDGAEGLEFCAPTPGAQNNCAQSGQDDGNETEEKQDESEIIIADAPDDARFGDSIDIELNVYKGDTSKYAVYVYVEDGDGNKVSGKITEHFHTKFSNQTVDIELQLDCENESGDYEIVAEGLDEEDRREIGLSACFEDAGDVSEGDENSSGITIGDFSYNVVVPNSIILDEKFQVKLKITSDAGQEQNFLVWSYVYEGSRCYSCGNGERESNAKSIVVPEKSSAETILENSVADADSGTYKLKIKVLQEGLKTAKEFTYDVDVRQNQNSSPEENSENNSEEAVSAPMTSNAIVETGSFSLKGAMPYFLAAICALAAIYALIKKI